MHTECYGYASTLLRHIFGMIVLAIGLAFGGCVGESAITRPALVASSQTEQNDPRGETPPEIEKATPTHDTPPITEQNGQAGKIPPEVEKALQKAMQMPAGKEREEVLNPVVLEWLKKDPTAALAWVHETGSAALGKVYLYVVARCGENHGKITADWCLQNKKYGSLHYSIRFWAMVDPLPASQWCVQAPDEVRHIAFSSLGNGWALKDVLAAAAGQLKLKSLEDRRSMAYGIGKSWSKPQSKDIVGATTWALGLKSQEERCSAIHGIGQGWCRYDLSALTAWIKALKSKEEVRAGAYSVVKEIQKKLVVDKAGEDDPEAYAKKWLDQLPLSDSEKTAILNGPAIDMKVTGAIPWPQ